jgi:S-DNA-T family DNA segregation ATPase FtsK/SpoIIIE
VVLGASAEGPLAVEPAHALIGGDNGTDVSELVRTVVAGQAATNHPDELDVALVSAGPGNPLSTCEDLPHVFEYVDAATDGEEGLDRLVRRLEYELDQREWPPDAEEGEEQRPPPRLLLAVDNLTSLAAEYPGFVESLVALAERGKRFGLRLVLGASMIEAAPGAALGPAHGERALVAALSTPVCLAADLRVAMYTTNAEAMRLLLGAGAVVPAAGTGADLPGRGQAKLPTGAVVPFQGAGVNSPMASSATPSSRPTVRIQDWHELGEPLKALRARRLDADGGPTDLSRLVGALKKAVD